MSKGSKNINNDTIGRNTDSVSICPHSFDVRAKREEFVGLMAQLTDKKRLAKRLSAYDVYYETAEGVYELTNVKAGRGSLGPTSRAVMALGLLVAAEGKASVRVKRNGLSSVACAMLVWLLGFVWTPAVKGQRLADGCMNEVIEDEGFVLAFAVNSLIVLVISTLAAMWVYDYKNRIQKGN